MLYSRHVGDSLYKALQPDNECWFKEQEGDQHDWSHMSNRKTIVRGEVIRAGAHVGL